MEVLLTVEYGYEEKFCGMLSDEMEVLRELILI